MSTRQPTVRDRAMEAAMVLVSRYGPLKVTMGDIAHEARCSRAALYKHFPTRDTLLSELWRAEAARFVGEIRTKYAGIPPTAQTMEDVFVEAIRFWRTHPATEAALRDPELLAGRGLGSVELGRARLDVVSAIFKGLADAGVVRRDVDPTVAAEVVLRMAMTYILAPAADGGPGEEQAIRVQFREVVVRGLLP